MAEFSDVSNGEKLRICVWSEQLGNGGMERVLTHLSNEFAKLGHTVSVYVHLQSNSYRCELIEDVEFQVIKDKGARGVKPKILPYAIEFMPIFKEFNPDILIASGYYMNAGAIVVRMLSGARAQVYIREANTFSAQSKDMRRCLDAWSWRLVRRLYPLADGIIAPSRGVAEDLIQSFPTSRHKIHTVPNPVAYDVIQRWAAEPLPADMSIKRPFILGVGRLVPQKDFATLIRAWAIVRIRHDVDLVILGEGPLEAELRALAGSLGLGQRLYLPGFDSNPFRFMQKCSCYALSSRFEGLPNTLLQAMAVGAPVVATDCPSGPREILQDGKLAPLIAVGDIQALADHVIRILDEPPNTSLLRKEIKTRYDPSVIAAKYIDTFYKINIR